MARPTFPNWPRRMKGPMAADYMGISPTKFLHGAKEGRYPQGYHDGGNVLWYIEDLDEWMDQQKGADAVSAPSEWMEAINGKD